MASRLTLFVHSRTQMTKTKNIMGKETSKKENATIKSEGSMRNCAIIDSILSLLKAYKALKGSESNKFDLDCLHYLLGQCIRQYDIPKENRHVSRAALVFWKTISTQKIGDYHYRNAVPCDNLKKEINVQSYTGATSTGSPLLLKPGKTFIFRNLFHEDHITPVSFILNELIDMDSVDKESIEDCLNKMHLCVLLKEEDRNLGRTKGRGDFETTIKDAYKDIELLPIDYQ